MRFDIGLRKRILQKKTACASNWQPNQENEQWMNEYYSIYINWFFCVIICMLWAHLLFRKVDLLHMTAHIDVTAQRTQCTSQTVPTAAAKNTCDPVNCVQKAKRDGKLRMEFSADFCENRARSFFKVNLFFAFFFSHRWKWKRMVLSGRWRRRRKCDEQFPLKFHDSPRCAKTASNENGWQFFVLDFDRTRKLKWRLFHILFISLPTNVS